jgi:hypothetical protein
MERVGEVVIPRPVVEQVAEDAQAVRLACRTGEKVEKKRTCPRCVRGQVQVRNE